MLKRNPNPETTIHLTQLWLTVPFLFLCHRRAAGLLTDIHVGCATTSASGAEQSLLHIDTTCSGVVNVQQLNNKIKENFASLPFFATKTTLWSTSNPVEPLISRKASSRPDSNWTSNKLLFTKRFATHGARAPPRLALGQESPGTQ